MLPIVRPPRSKYTARLTPSGVLFSPECFHRYSRNGAAYVVEVLGARRGLYIRAVGLGVATERNQMDVVGGFSHGRAWYHLLRDYAVEGKLAFELRRPSASSSPCLWTVDYVRPPEPGDLFMIRDINRPNPYQLLTVAPGWWLVYSLLEDRVFWRRPRAWATPSALQVAEYHQQAPPPRCTMSLRWQRQYWLRKRLMELRA